jgi:transcription initiation factor TFIIIB Brf1 subunit/transcription initiation factor TFIIB
MTEKIKIIDRKCPKCGTEFSIVELLRVSKRGTIYCPKCRQTYEVEDISLLDGVGLLSTRQNLKERTRQYLRYACKELKLSQEVEEMAWGLLEGFNEDWGMRSVVAGALYLACLIKNERRSQHEIASVLKLSEVNVRNRYIEISRRLNIDRERLRSGSFEKWRQAILYKSQLHP